jgi:transcriptional regulator with XRE-family HTH domain
MWRAWDDKDDQRGTARRGAVLIGRSLRQARLGNGFTQEQLAWRAGLSQSSVSRLESGRLSGIRFRTLALMVGVLEDGPVPAFYAGPRPARRRLPGQIPPTDPEHVDEEAA